MPKSKLEKLVEIEGLTVEQLLQQSVSDSVVPGICVAPECDYTTMVEPDCRGGWCEECQANTVQSACVIAGLI